MLLQIENILAKDELLHFREQLSAANWVDGRITAGYQSSLAKNNLQLAEDNPTAISLGKRLKEQLSKQLLFQSAALPQEIFPPLFNLYREGQHFGTHVDNAYRPYSDREGRMRTDLSATLFLSEPDSYDGGELVIEDTFGTQSVKLPAGHMVLYPATSLHYVEPVRRGERLASFFWIKSLVADDSRRSLLFDIDMSIQSLRQDVPDDHPALISLTGSYHNLLRMWGS